MALDHRALRHPLHELVARRRQRRARTRCAPASVGGSATITAARAHARAVGAHATPPASLDRAHRRLPSTSVAHALGQPQRDELRAADEAVLLRAALGRRSARRASRPEDVEEDVQQRDVARLARPHRLDGDLQQRRARRASRCCARSQVAKRLRVPALGPGAPATAPRSTWRAMRSSRACACATSASTAGASAGSARGSGTSRPCRLDQVVAVAVGREVSTPSSPASAASRSWVGPIHWPPTSTTLPVAERAGSACARRRGRAPRARPRGAARLQVARGGEPGQPGADDADIGFVQIHLG